MSRKILLLLVIAVLLLFSVVNCAAPEKSEMPLVLLTDYGTNDYRVPRLKGVIYSTFTNAVVIDATHGIASYDIAAGAYVLGLTAKEFPEDFIFIAAVGARSTAEEKSLVLTTNKNQIFIAPDNGLLTYVIRDEGIKTVYEVNNQDLFDQPIAALSSHYLLGKIGALIASGYNPEDVGPPVGSPVLLDIQESSIVDGKLAGSVVFIDHFGNCLTNITGDTLSQYGAESGDKVQVIIAGNLLEAKIGNTYDDVDIGEPVIIVNSLGTLQLSINKGSFAGTYGIKTGVKFEIDK